MNVRLLAMFSFLIDIRRWMFIISALMTVPVAIAGVFIWPGTPGKPNKLFLTDSDLALAVKRLEEEKADTEKEIGRAHV